MHLFIPTHRVLFDLADTRVCPSVLSVLSYLVYLSVCILLLYAPLFPLQFNMAPANEAPFTGMSAFAHKGGIHVSAVNKIPDSYQHIDPGQVGNQKRLAAGRVYRQAGGVPR